jgi:lantibiotic biosynthesis protein
VAGTALLHARLAAADPVFGAAADGHWEAAASCARRHRAIGAGIFATGGGAAPCPWSLPEGNRLDHAQPAARTAGTAAASAVSVSMAAGAVRLIQAGTVAVAGTGPS